jgi:hypothetical protein
VGPGAAPVHVIEHGVSIPSAVDRRAARIATAINDPARRGRLVGADRSAPSRLGPLDPFGMNTARAPGHGGRSPQADMHRQVARPGAGVHPFR